MADPATSLVVTGGMIYARFVEGIDFREVSPLRSIAREQTPILLIHGLADWRTPLSNLQALYHANPRNSLWNLRVRRPIRSSFADAYSGGSRPINSPESGKT